MIPLHSANHCVALIVHPDGPSAVIIQGKHFTDCRYNVDVKWFTYCSTLLLPTHI